MTQGSPSGPRPPPSTGPKAVPHRSWEGEGHPSPFPAGHCPSVWWAGDRQGAAISLLGGACTWIRGGPGQVTCAICHGSAGWGRGALKTHADSNLSTPCVVSRPHLQTEGTSRTQACSSNMTPSPPHPIRKRERLQVGEVEASQGPGHHRR